MLTVIFNKPNKSVEISAYGVGSYFNKKTNKMVYTIYGITQGARELVYKKEEDGTEKYKVTPNDVIIHRTDSEEEAIKIKNYMDFIVANGFRIFNMIMYEEMIRKEQFLMEQEKKKKVAVLDMAGDSIPDKQPPNVIPFPTKDEVNPA